VARAGGRVCGLDRSTALREPSYSSSVEHPYGVVTRHSDAAPFISQQPAIVITPTGTWLCAWTRAREDEASDQAVVVARSEDDGRTWGEPITVEGATEGPRTAAWIVPFVVPHTGRVYTFYWWKTEPNPLREAGIIYMRYSDDDGRTWSRRDPPWPRRYPLPMPRHAPIDEEGHQVHGWHYGLPKIMPNGQVVFTFSKIRPSTISPWLEAAQRIDSRQGDPSEAHDQLWHTQAFLMVCENLLVKADPQRLKFTVLPERRAGIHVRLPTGGCTGEEVNLNVLANGNWLATFRTALGCIYFAVSSDEGRAWSAPQPLRFCPNGPIVPHPCAPQPLVRLADGRFVLLFHNNPGDANGGVGPCDETRVRTPLWVLVGRELPGLTRGQRILWGSPKVIVDNHVDFSRGPFPRRTAVNYPQFLEWSGRYFVCYADRDRDILINEVDPRLIDDFGLPV
jgi:hypothetical protein